VGSRVNRFRGTTAIIHHEQDSSVAKKSRAFCPKTIFLNLTGTIAQLYLIRMLQRTLPAGFIAPCLPTKTDKLPSGSQWLHEIKHDGFRIIARKTGAQLRLYSRPGNDLTRRFPLIVETLIRLRSRSCIIDGEAVACDDNGVASSISSVTTALTRAYSSTPST
jgi:ATP-dependent DNA ligase